jgi:alpha-L-fucosidase 2
MEWIEDYEETEIGHRHISQAFGLYPASLITRKDKELYKAIETTLDRRLSKPDKDFSSGMGWTVTWIAILFARLRKSERAYGMLNKFTTRTIVNNLWEIINIPFMGGDVFQIDANLAYVASVCEMLLQSHEGVIALLPAVPKSWHSGSFRGLCARGGYEIDAQWRDLDVKEFTVRAKFSGKCTVELPETQKSLKFSDDRGNIYIAENSLVEIEVVSSVTLTAIE